MFAQPDGDLAFESWAEPQWVERDGEWVDIDTSLSVGDDGLIRPAAAADVVFSAGGSAPFATMSGSGAEFSLSWLGTLPNGIIDGDSVVYPEVYDGVDLVVRAERKGFSHLLVVKTPKAAKNPAVRDARYIIGGNAKVATADGGVTVSGPQGVVATAPPAQAWDSTRPRQAAAGALSGLDAAVAPSVSTHRAPGATARITDVDVRVESRQLRVSLDAASLDNAAYPLYIDPTLRRGAQQLGSRQQPESRHELPVGHGVAA